MQLCKSLDNDQSEVLTKRELDIALPFLTSQGYLKYQYYSIPVPISLCSMLNAKKWNFPAKLV